jgi:hypothetical protein
MKVVLLYDPEVRRGTRSLDHNEFIKQVQKEGHATSSQLDDGVPTSPKELYDYMAEKISGADLVIADLSVQSTNTGLLVGLAVQNGKRVLALYPSPLPISKFVISSPLVHAYLYSDTVEAAWLCTQWLKGKLNV